MDTIMKNERPMFVMSMFANKEALLEAKCKWLENEKERLDKVVTKLEEDLKLAETSTGRDDW